MADAPPICDFGWEAPNFSLKAVDGNIHSLNDLKGPNGTLIVFMCQHCPYVKAIIDKLVRDANELRNHGVHTIGINSNDADSYPEDDFDHMVAISKYKEFSFRYLWDENQAIAKLYGAVCTPDFFGFNKNLELQYRGRLDETKTSDVPDAKRELFQAMVQISETGEGPHQQIATMGCSIKWKVE